MNKDIIRNVLFLFLEKVITIILVFYSEGMIARMLSVEEYGQWIYSVNFVLLLSSLSLIVGSEISVVSLARNKIISGQIIVSVFLIRLIFSLVAFFICVFYAYYYIHNDVTKKFVLILSFVLIFSETFGVISNYFQANVRMLPIIVIRILGLITRTLVILICFYWLQSDKLLIGLSRVIEVLIVSLLLVFLFLKLRRKLVFSLNLQIIKVIFYRGLKLWPALVFMYLFQRIDRFFIEKYFSYEVLSQYGIAVQLMEQAFLLIGIVVQSISPKLIYAKLSEVELKKNILILLVITLCVSGVFYISGYLAIPYMINFIYGDKYLLAIDLSRMMLITLFLFSLDTVVMQYLYREKMASYILIKWIILSLISSLNYYLLLEMFEINSLTIVYIINYFFMAAFSIFILLRRLRSEY